jgi:hypothetical protein
MTENERSHHGMPAIGGETTESARTDGENTHNRNKHEPHGPPGDPTMDATDPDETDIPAGIQYGEHGRCEAYARSAGRRCLRPAVGAHGKCDKHGGASTGPADPTMLKDNDHAEGNPGGGPPEGNTNAMTYGAWCDWRKQYERLDRAAKAHVNTLIEAVIESSKTEIDGETREEKARELAMCYQLVDNARVQVFEEGWGVESEVQYGDETVTTIKPNPAITAERRHKRRKRKLQRELRTYSSPDGRPWTERSGSQSE